MNKNNLHIIFSFFCLILFTQQILAQENAKPLRKKNQFFHNIFKRIKSSVTVSKPDSTIKATVLNTKSVVPYYQYKGKVIRSITTREMGFEKVFTDTDRK